MRSHPALLRGALERLGLTAAELLALVVLVVAAAIMTGAIWWANGGAVTSAEGDPAPAVTVPVPTVAEAPPEPVPDLILHVAGAVNRPGLVRVSAGGRVADAIDAAGGLTAVGSVDGLNLARHVADGEQIVVGVEGEAPPPQPLASTTGSLAGTGSAPLNLNTATVEQLQSLPGVGPVTAERILAHRERIGTFVDVAQLLDVPGIGPATFADLEPLVVV